MYDWFLSKAEILKIDGFSPSFAQTIVDDLEAQRGFTLGALLLYQPDSNGLQPVALSRQGRDDAFVIEDKRYVASKLPVAAGITGWVAATAQSARIDDVSRDSRYFAMREDIRTELCVPVTINDGMLGVLNTERTSTRPYTEKDQRLLEATAKLISSGFSSSAGVDVICAWCRSARIGPVWRSEPVSELEESAVSHGMCPSCYASFLADHYRL